jgi:phosphoenolpyruvate carboxykinase (GTP)
MSFAERAPNAPKIFHVNWFRKGADGKFLWPGFGDNMRVLEWVLQRCAGQVGAVETPIGALPHRQDLNLDGLVLDHATLDQLLGVDRFAWQDEFDAIVAYLDEFGARTPDALRQEAHRIRAALED